VVPGELDFWVPIDDRPESVVEVLIRDPGHWLPGPAEPRGPGHWAVTITAGPVRRTATCGVGEASGDDRALTRRLVWKVDPEPSEDAAVGAALPTVAGTLEVRPAGDRRTDLRLVGTYQAPDGTVGSALGPSQMQALAEASASGFLNALAGRVSAEL
jgi:hypothetical protein